MSDHQMNQHTTLEPSLQSDNKPTVVGLYGVPGAGKTVLLNELKQELGQTSFVFYEGSEMIASIVPGGLDVFQRMEDPDKVHWRRCAINAIGKDGSDSGRTAVVTGHFMFWPEGHGAGQSVYTQSDLDVFTHILYLDIPADLIVQRCLDDTQRKRPSASTAHIERWQQAEKTQLRQLCRERGILFSLVSSYATPLSKVAMLLRDFQHHTETYNLSCAERRLDEVIETGQGQLDIVLVIDADKTLAAQDTGALFWKMKSTKGQLGDEECRLQELFSGPLGYSYTAFRQAMLLYEEATDDQMFDELCEDVASAVSMYPEFICLLQLVSKQKHMGVVILTCGLHNVWRKVLEKEGLINTVQVIGGGRIADGFVVTAAVKGALVTHLRSTHQVHVWAFGDSPLDLEMLIKANQAFVVVGEESTRSKSMDIALANAIDHLGLQARQVVLPSNVVPRLDVAKLPTIKLTEPGFVESLLGGRYTHGLLPVHLATDRSAGKLLATPMRDAAMAGPSLRTAHHRVGWYLAMEFVTSALGLEQAPIRHVLGHQTRGYQLLHEQRTTIVALMRGGEPMAYGVNEAFPAAMFLHASEPDDIKLHHLQEQVTVILVDSVVNTGKSIVEFVQHVRKLHATISIVVVAGVVQAQCVLDGILDRAFARHANLQLIALRLSDTKFTGSGTTDTGNRLFNTTHLP
ncbi:MAG: hypothetical protein L6R41_001013 [Letrouitia leprolyta]|nr:MAG: hypothetical protein L6R41_001013 [Letrouitia leprolyta]